MSEFFKVWELAHKIYGLSRLVHVDLEEAYMRIYLEDKIIVRVEGTFDELEDMYIAAALRLLQWMQVRGVKL